MHVEVKKEYVYDNLTEGQRLCSLWLVTLASAVFARRGKNFPQLIPLPNTPLSPPLPLITPQCSTATSLALSVYLSSPT